MLPNDRQAAALATLAAADAEPYGVLDLIHAWRLEAEAETRRADALQQALDDIETGPVLNERAAEHAAALDEPIRLYRTPQRWHDDGRQGVLVLDWTDARLPSRLHLGSHRVVAEDAETRRLLRAALDGRARVAA